MGARKENQQRNRVHESIRRTKLIQNEAKTAATWEENWGFLKGLPLSGVKVKSNVKTPRISRLSALAPKIPTIENFSSLVPGADELSALPPEPSKDDFLKADRRYVA